MEVDAGTYPTDLPYGECDTARHGEDKSTKEIYSEMVAISGSNESTNQSAFCTTFTRCCFYFW